MKISMNNHWARLHWIHVYYWRFSLLEQMTQSEHCWSISTSVTNNIFVANTTKIRCKSLLWLRHRCHSFWLSSFYNLYIKAKWIHTNNLNMLAWLGIFYRNRVTCWKLVLISGGFMMSKVYHSSILQLIVIAPNTRDDKIWMWLMYGNIWKNMWKDII